LTFSSLTLSAGGFQLEGTRQIGYNELTYRITALTPFSISEGLLMQFRGKFLRDGEIILRHADVELEHSVQDGVKDWKGSFTGPVKRFLTEANYSLVLDNGRTADIQLEPGLIDTSGPAKMNFGISGGFR
jgi:hypothetical protein